MLAALDSNFMIYAEDMFGDPRRDQAIALLNLIPPNRIVIPVQAAGEALNWLIKKGKVPKALASQRIANWLELYASQPTSLAVVAAARELVSHHDFQVWDSVILAASAEASADILISEDMQDGFHWRGVTIVNPFRPKPSPHLQKLIS
ncbi:MAG: PIN domain-containing protein [Alphaproteobacteria bacterium]|nr:PIN domain-containing protein [Alphaproteobacteria bacterium]